MSAPETPIERLNFYNGQRLDAHDLRAEQAYHMLVRRWLNRSLFEPGIAEGLEVNPDPDNTHQVIVSPGLALDGKGREIILAEEVRLLVRGSPKSKNGVQLGNYLVIAYAEEKVAPLQDGCRVTMPPVAKEYGCGCGAKNRAETSLAGRDLGWGAPSRIREEPQLFFQDAWPSDSSGHILLAQVELDDQCKVIQVNTGVRRYAVKTNPPVTTPLSLEGEKDIDRDNPKLLVFHINGGYPDKALLYLQGGLFSTLYYTEIGSHTHELDLELYEDGPALPAHFHTFENELTTTEEPGHNHIIRANIHGGKSAIVRDDTNYASADLRYAINMEVDLSKPHSHTIAAGAKTDEKPGLDPHGHSFKQKVARRFGAEPDALGGPAKQYIKELHVEFDGKDITDKVIAQLKRKDPAWDTLGDGTAGHRFALEEAGPIDLKLIDDVDLSPGIRHWLKFWVGDGGGQVRYNLYIS